MSEPILALPAPEEPLLLPAPKRPPADNGRRRRVVVIALIVIVVLALIGWSFHHRQANAAKEANDRARDRIPTVSVVEVKASPSTSDLRLPGTISALTEASLFARASGYVRTRYVDIGDTVRRGQVLAEIDSPDLDAQVAQARDQLDAARSAIGDAKARVALSQVTFDRLSHLVKDQAVSQQQVDQGRQDLDTAKAGLTSNNASLSGARANLERLTVLQGYEKLRAPFDGIVSARNVDVGALINGSGATSGQGGGSNSTTTSAMGSSASTSGSASTATQNGTSAAPTEMFRIAQADRVRVFVTVPQENASLVEPDRDASVYVQGFDEPFTGRVTRTARSIDPTARTLLTEVQVANADGRLVPGMYAQVRFAAQRQGTPLLVPGEAVIARASGLSIAVIEDLRPEDREKLPKKKHGDPASSGGKDASGSEDSSGSKDSSNGKGTSDEKEDDPADARRIHLQQVEVGRDYGTEIEITRGLRAGSTIVSNPGDEVAEGAIVMPKKQQKEQGAGEGKLGNDRPTSGNQSPSREAPTKGRK